MNGRSAAKSAIGPSKKILTRISYHRTLIIYHYTLLLHIPYYFIFQLSRCFLGIFLLPFENEQKFVLNLFSFWAFPCRNIKPPDYERLFIYLTICTWLLVLLCS